MVSIHYCYRLDGSWLWYSMVTVHNPAVCFRFVYLSGGFTSYNPPQGSASCPEWPPQWWLLGSSPLYLGKSASPREDVHGYIRHHPLLNLHRSSFSHNVRFPHSLTGQINYHRSSVYRAIYPVNTTNRPSHTSSSNVSSSRLPIGYESTLKLQSQCRQ